MVAVAGILIRPWRSSEWMWAVGGAVAVVLFRLVSIAQASRAVLSGWNVYLFLVGILMLAELARSQGLFDWTASSILRAGGGSQRRLFSLFFGAGVLVTAFLCNDTTAIVLTTAVVAVLHRAGLRALPYLYACAFVAGAASFALPISNPANLVVFASHLPRLGPWLTAFGLPTIVALAAVFVAMQLRFRTMLNVRYDPVHEPLTLTRASLVAGYSVAAVALAIVGVNAFGGPVGATAAIGALLALLLTCCFDRHALATVARAMSWGVIPLVAGLFVIVAALDTAGAVGIAHAELLAIAGLPGGFAHLAIGAVVTVAANLFNNLPIALFARQALAGQSAATTHAAVVAIDLGPNLSVTGSLATLLWLVVLRRENVRVTPWQYLQVAAVVTIPALILAELCVR